LISKALRCADIALTSTKKSAKSEENDFCPQIVTLDSSGQALLNGNPIDQSQLEIETLPLAEGILKMLLIK